MFEPCQLIQRWFSKKSNMEIHLLKIRSIDVVLPKGLKIEGEEQSTPKKISESSFFSNYERQQSIKRFLDPKIEYIRSHQSY